MYALCAVYAGTGLTIAEVCIKILKSMLSMTCFSMIEMLRLSTVLPLMLVV